MAVVTALVLRGDAAHLPLPDGSVDLIVTSPPYWGVRDYRDGGESLAGQIGNEERWQDYLANLLRCTQEWVRVLKPEGSIFVNLGDKYANDAKWGGATSGKHVGGLHGKTGIGRAKVRTGIPPKSLIGLPSRYAIACVDDLGLTWRRDNIWWKTSAMPESVDDRCATRHEYVLHLTLQGDYYAGIDEIREPAGNYSRPGNYDRGRRGAPNGVNPRTFADTVNPAGKLPGSVWDITPTPLNVPEWLEHGRCCGGRKQEGCEDGLDHHAAFPFDLVRKVVLGWSPSGICLECGEGRFPVAHREVIPLRPGDVPGRNALNHDAAHGRDRRAGTHKASLSTIIGYACICTPFTDHPERRGKDFHNQAVRRERGMNDGDGGERFRRYMEELANPRGPVREYHFDRWTSAPTRPALVVDPFGGSGTTALVASLLGRNAVTMDRSGDYCQIATWRINDPAERARALGVPKPPPVPEGQVSLFDLLDEAPAGSEAS